MDKTNLQLLEDKVDRLLERLEKVENEVINKSVTFCADTIIIKPEDGETLTYEVAKNEPKTITTPKSPYCAKCGKFAPESGPLHVCDTPPAPKFWVRYVQSQHKENPDPVLFHDLQPFESRLKVYCHTREGLEQMLLDYEGQSYMPGRYLTNYLKSDEGV